MADGPSDVRTHAEQRELDALRRRAYGPEPDILRDLVALARLRELEDRIHRQRFGIALEEPTRTLPADPPGRESRWTLNVVAGTLAAAVLAATIAWSASQGAPIGDAATTGGEIAADVDKPSRVGDQRFLDDLRDEVAALPGTEAVANRMMRGQLRPYGILFGRIVAAGRTLDDEFCMIIADLPESSITCIPVDREKAQPASVALPAWLTDSDSDLFTGLGALVLYTLSPGGVISAVPAH